MKNLMQDSQAYYQDNDYYEIFSRAEDYPGYITDFIKNNLKCNTILDAGCGTGKFINILESVSNKYIGIDLSKDQINKALTKSNKTNSQFIVSNLNNIPLEDNSVDIIISEWVLGTIKDIEERDKCIEELKRVLKKDGRIYLIENNSKGEFEDLREKYKTHATTNYNNYLLNRGFKIIQKYNSYFLFNNIDECKQCFNVIYGNKVSNKITKEKINHDILIFEYINYVNKS